MSLVGLVNLAERLLNQSDNQGQDAQATQKAGNVQTTQGAQGAAAAEDQFTPSAQNAQIQGTAQDAGLFSVSQFSFFSAAADFLLAQTTAPAPEGNPAAIVPGGGNGNGAAAALLNAPAAQTGAAEGTAFPAAPAGLNGDAAGVGRLAAFDAPVAPQIAFAAPPTARPLAGLLQGVTARNGGTALDGARTGDTQTPATGPTGALAAAPATNTATANAATGALRATQQLQALNNALAALGLDPQQIQELDQIASIIKDFNPALYTALAYQLEALAQQTQQAAGTPANGAAQGATANPAAANGNTAVANTSVGNVGAANAGAGTNSNPAGAPANGGFQVQELVIRFTGVETQATAPANGNAAGTGQTAPPNGNAAAAESGAATNGNGNANLQVAAFNLQIEEVNLTLINGNGQTAQIQAPAAATDHAAGPRAHAARA